MNDRDYEGATQPFDASLARAKLSDWNFNHRNDRSELADETLEEDSRGTERPDRRAT